MAERVSRACEPLVQYHAGVRTCYLPTQVAVAEASLVPHPIRPVFIVRRAVRARLTQVIVLSGSGRGAPGTAIAIAYVFGIPEPPCSDMPGCRKGSPYVIVQETVGRAGRSGFDVAKRSGIVPGPWRLEVDLKHRNLTLSVITNTSRAVVWRIGRDVRHADAKDAARKPGRAEEGTSEYGASRRTQMEQPLLLDL